MVGGIIARYGEISGANDRSLGPQSIKRIQEFAELPREETFAETQALKLHIDPKKPWPTVGSIEFKDYSMRYK